MGRAYDFTCHTCRTHYEIGYGSYGGTVEPQWGESLEEYLARASGSDLANTRRYEECMKEHFAHEWDTLTEEFDDEGVIPKMRAGYANVDLEKRDRDKEAAERAILWKFADEVIPKEGDFTPRQLALLMVEKFPEMGMDEESTTHWLEGNNWIGLIRAKRIPLPKELQTKLKNWKARVRARAEKGEA